MNGSLKIILIFLALISTASTFSSCSGGQVGLTEESSEAPVDPVDDEPDPLSEGTPDVPSLYADIMDQFFVSLDANTAYPFTYSKLDDFNTRCAIASGTTAAAMDCVVDAPELGFYFGGLIIAFNVPANYCEYTRVTPYWYYNHEIGYGPSAVSMETTTDASGNSSYRCSLNGAALTDCSAATGVEGFFVSVGGAPEVRCSYDTSRNKPGANCCMGTYSLTTITRTAGASDSTTNDPAVEWGGKVEDCIGGQGKTNWKFANPQGYPSPIIKYTGAGINQLQKYTVKAPILGVNSGSNISVVNYFSTSGTDILVGTDDHAHTGYSPGTSKFSPNPYYVTPITDRSGDPILTGSPYYEFACLDHAHEVKRKIRLLVREWDTNRAYANYSVSGVVSAPRPWDLIDEEDNCDGLSPEVCNDYVDADDFVFYQTGSAYTTTSATRTRRASYFPREDYTADSDGTGGEE